MEPETIIKQALGGRYEIQSVIGKGGMATVYKAIQTNLNRFVALKIIHQNLVHDDEFINRFIREAQVCASLNNPNIVTVYDIGTVGTIHYMAMEYLEGMTLRDLIQSNGTLGFEEVVDLIVPIANALGYIHQKGIVHRDIKSSNIFITNNGRSVLMDFGIVYSEGRESLSQSGTVLGTPEYMSPEQAEGIVKADSRSDIYSLGVIMFECLTGRLPFHSDNYLATLHQVLHNSPPSVRSINPKVPAWLNNIVLACLVKDRTMRISNGTALAKALKTKESPEISRVAVLDDQLTRKIISGELRNGTISEKRAGKSQLKGERKKRKPILIFIFLTLVLILVILGALILNPEKLRSSSGYGGGNISVTNQDKPKTVPKVLTTLVKMVGLYTVESGGIITDDGGSPVISRGVCWSTSHNPTTIDKCTIDGKGIGNFTSIGSAGGKGIDNFTSIVLALEPQRTYYLRAYATNSYGTAYGEELSFSTPSKTNQTKQPNMPMEDIHTTSNTVKGTEKEEHARSESLGEIKKAKLPTILTLEIQMIGKRFASIGCTILGDGGGEVTERGICWRRTQYPTLTDSKERNGSGTGYFLTTTPPQALTPNTTYYVRGYAINSLGTAYGEQIRFTTLPY